MLLKQIEYEVFNMLRSSICCEVCPKCPDEKCKIQQNIISSGTNILELIFKYRKENITISEFLKTEKI